ncbi:MAG: Na/Pi cotransporter family protein [Clostridia bacterium]|nr:Na/Pi cotransporter family protein [Clostridia bacterium]
MTIFDVFTLLGGLALFLYGMKVMGDALEKSAGRQLKNILAKLTSNTFNGFLLGLGVTMIIQSSSATTVMVVGFVNSAIMTLHQATGVIMGANLGTSITAWLLATTAITGENLPWYVELCKPSTFSPLLAFAGIVLVMFQKNEKRRDIGHILIGFAVLMTGMDVMSASVEPLAESAEFQAVLTKFANPIVGILVGTIFTAIIQSSSASVGILQALSLTGAVSYRVAIPVVIGQNIGTCVSALISSIGAGKNARRAALVHLYFNILAACIVGGGFYALNYFISFELPAVIDPLGIAVVHTTFKIIALIFIMPFSRVLEKLAMLTVPNTKDDEDNTQLLDDRLLATPAVAIETSRKVAVDMAKLSVRSLKNSILLLNNYTDKGMESVKAEEDKVDKYEDTLGTYLVKVSSQELTESDGHELTKLLHIIGDFERISDHAVNIAGTAQEMAEKKVTFSEKAQKEITVMVSAVEEILDSALDAFCNGDTKQAFNVEPLEEVIDYLNAKIKKRHVTRLQRGECTIELGFVLNDLLNNLERVSDHCSNIAGCVIEMEHDALDLHEYLNKLKSEENSRYTEIYNDFKDKYVLPPKDVVAQ